MDNKLIQEIHDAYKRRNLYTKIAYVGSFLTLIFCTVCLVATYQYENKIGNEKDSAYTIAVVENLKKRVDSIIEQKQILIKKIESIDAETEYIRRTLNKNNTTEFLSQLKAIHQNDSAKGIISQDTAQLHVSLDATTNQITHKDINIVRVRSFDVDWVNIELLRVSIVLFFIYITRMWIHSYIYNNKLSIYYFSRYTHLLYLHEGRRYSTIDSIDTFFPKDIDYAYPTSPVKDFIKLTRSIKKIGLIPSEKK